MSYKFKIGETVRVRDWDDMLAEYGPDGRSNYITTPGNIVFIQSMKKFCGNIYTVDSFSCDDNYYLRDEYGRLLNTSDADFRFNDAMLEPVNTVFDGPSSVAPTISFDELFAATNENEV